jgi:hypothetical protein
MRRDAALLLAGAGGHHLQVELSTFARAKAAKKINKRASVRLCEALLNNKGRAAFAVHRLCRV